MYRTELKQIYAEIAGLERDDADLQMLEALANNAVYVLSKMQQSENQTERAVASLVLTDMLNTINKELLWAKEEDIPTEKINWFVKAKSCFLEDMQVLFE